MSDAIYGIKQWRRHAVLAAFGVGVLVLAWRVIDLQVINNEDFQNKGDNAHLKVVAIPAHRGMIVDRNDEPLAISSPVNAIWGVPKELSASKEQLPELARALDVKLDVLTDELTKRAGRDFMYLKRRGSPQSVEKIKAMAVPGVYFQREYKRFYPAGEVTAHVLGFTNVDDMGQEGVELAFDHWLRGEYGSKRVLQDRMGNILADVEPIEDARSGGELTLSLDKRIQYLAYRELKVAVEAHKAKSGSMVVLDALTGEVLAMVNQPAFNPNARHSISRGAFRNRAVTDLFEPGSTVKPFVAAAALESGKFMANTLIDTAPGQFYVGRNRVKDIRNYGLIDVSTVIKKSSNVGVTKMALAMDKEYLWQKYVDVGFGAPTGMSFPGEQSGYVNNFQRWARIDQATIAFGYGISSTALQLARAYTVFANDGELKPISLQRLDQAPKGVKVFKKDTVEKVIRMMEGAVADDGTAPKAQIAGYRVAGKTGTVKKADAQGGYTEDKYVSLFAGMVPASNPRLIGVVVVDRPGGDDFYGGVVAAPVFSKVMAGALRLLDITPDDINQEGVVTGKVAHRETHSEAGAL
jgi:cell division protein FtsI (penicillin-binding protein 3)